MTNSTHNPTQSTFQNPTPNENTAPFRSPGARMMRSRTDKRLFGVCGGIAAHFDVDPNVVRLAVAALALFGGSTIPLYILAALILPEEPVTAEFESLGAPLSAIA